MFCWVIYSSLYDIQVERIKMWGKEFEHPTEGGKEKLSWKEEEIRRNMYFLTSTNGCRIKNKGSEWWEEGCCLKEPDTFKEFKRKRACYWFFWTQIGNILSLLRYKNHLIRHHLRKLVMKKMAQLDARGNYNNLQFFHGWISPMGLSRFYMGLVKPLKGDWHSELSSLLSPSLCGHSVKGNQAGIVGCTGY